MRSAERSPVLSLLPLALWLPERLHCALLLAPAEYLDQRSPLSLDAAGAAAAEGVERQLEVLLLELEPPLCV
jgi:hypothetical protein